MKLSKHFTLAEFCKSQTAIRKNIDNTPTDPRVIDALKALCVNVLEPIRLQFGPVIINSGYRGSQLNRAIGGATKSQHLTGHAADIEIPGMSNLKLAKWITKYLNFDQVILEFWDPAEGPMSGWVHVSYVGPNVNRRSTLTARKIDGKVVYRPGINT